MSVQDADPANALRRTISVQAAPRERLAEKARLLKDFYGGIWAHNGAIGAAGTLDLLMCCNNMHPAVVHGVGEVEYVLGTGRNAQAASLAVCF